MSSKEWKAWTAWSAGLVLAVTSFFTSEPVVWYLLGLATVCVFFSYMLLRD